MESNSNQVFFLSFLFCFHFPLYIYEHTSKSNSFSLESQNQMPQRPIAAFGPDPDLAGPPKTGCLLPFHQSSFAQDQTKNRQSPEGGSSMAQTEIRPLLRGCEGPTCLVVEAVAAAAEVVQGHRVQLAGGVFSLWRAGVRRKKT